MQNVDTKLYNLMFGANKIIYQFTMYVMLKSSMFDFKMIKFEIIVYYAQKIVQNVISYYYPILGFHHETFYFHFYLSEN